MDAVHFWDMTLKEIITTIEAEQRKIKAKVQIDASIAYRQAYLTAALVSNMFSKSSKQISISEAFPGIFPEKEQQRQQPWQLMKERIEAFAAAKRKRGEDNG